MQKLYWVVGQPPSLPLKKGGQKQKKTNNENTKREKTRNKPVRFRVFFTSGFRDWILTGCCPNPTAPGAVPQATSSLQGRSVTRRFLRCLAGGRCLFFASLTAKSPTSLGPQFHGLSVGETPGPQRRGCVAIRHLSPQ